VVNPFSLHPGVLIAAPQLDGPAFSRSVILLIQHDADGAVGLVLNQVINHPCTEVTAAFGLPWNGEVEARLRRGGPVEPQSLWMLHGDGWAFDETTRVALGVSASRSREALTRMSLGGEARLRLFVGYAGWGPGQLEREIARGVWIHGEASADLVFEVVPEEMWRVCLARLGIDPACLMDPVDLVH
jgi:putative transcriptional regulator